MKHADIMNNEKPRNIADAFFRAASIYPENTAFIYYREGLQSLSYKALADNVNGLASFLLQREIKKGERVAILSENRHEWCAAYLAIVSAGAVAVPLDAQLGASEVSRLLSDSEAKLVFCSGSTAGNIDVRKGAQITTLNFDSGQYMGAPGLTHEDVISQTALSDLASIIYTSGTTGMPKGVMLTHDNFLSDADGMISMRIVSHQDNVLSILPLHHTYAFMCTFLVPLKLGATITYPPSLKGPDIMSAVRDNGVTVLLGVPQLFSQIRSSMLARIESLPKPLSSIMMCLYKLSGLLRRMLDINIGRFIFRPAHKALGSRFRFFGSGGARLDPDVMTGLEAFGFTVLEGYGLTETSPVVTFNRPDKRKPGSAGLPLPSVELRILNPEENSEGEIAVRGPMVMKGYYKDPEATSSVIKDGWFLTGDIGKIDSDGFIFITGRSKEVIVLGSGKNIYPEEVEKIYLLSPLIRDICILGRAQGGPGEQLHAVIVPDFDYARSYGIDNVLESIKWEITNLSERLPQYMRIRGYTISKEALPRTPLGKLRRFMIADMLRYGEKDKEKAPVEETSLDNTAERVMAAVSGITHDQGRVRLDDNLELDLGLDSLSKLELMAVLEGVFSVSLPDDFMAGLITVQDLIDAVKEKIGAGMKATAGLRTGWQGILMKGPSESELAGLSIAPHETGMFVIRMLFMIVQMLFRLLFRLEARGVENIPLGTYILAPNHTSYLDGFVLILSLPFSYFKKIYSLGQRDFFVGPVRGRLARLSHVIPIDQSSLLKALQMSAYVLGKGLSLSVFPEGGRSLDGSLMEFKKGVGILAVELGVPLVPVCIHGAYDALPRNAVIPKPGKVTVTFGSPVYVSEIDFSKKPGDIDKYQHVANILKEKVEAIKSGYPT